ncbi:MAG TPA: hypothetical protein H9680_06920 [Firmicutes bacterium]|nr:hypothetical protein [Bacillota bacterium]
MKRAADRKTARRKRAALCLAAAILVGAAVAGCGAPASPSQAAIPREEPSAPMEEESSSVSPAPPQEEQPASAPGDSSSGSPASPAAGDTDAQEQEAPSSQWEEPAQGPLDPLVFVVIDSNGTPAVNAQVTLKTADDAQFWGYWRTGSQGQVTVPPPEGLAWGSYLLGIETAGPGGESAYEEVPVTLAPGEKGASIPVQMAGESLYEQVKKAENRVEICLLDLEGNPLPDLWVTTNLMGDQFPDTGGFLVPGEGYTDQDGVVYFDQYDSPYASLREQAGTKRVGIRLEEGYRPLNSIRVPVEPGVKRYTMTVDLEALPPGFRLRMVDRDGVPIQNTKAVVNVEEQASFLAITNSRGEITVPEDYFEGLRYGVEYGVNLELDSVTGGQGVETQPFVLTPAAWSEPVVVSWPFPSPYEALKTAPDRVEITIQDGRGNPIPDLWVIASFGGTQEPDRGGSKGTYEGYTDQEGTIYFTQYHPGEIPVGISPAGESYRQLGTISVTGEPGVQSFLFVLE